MKMKTNFLNEKLKVFPGTYLFSGGTYRNPLALISTVVLYDDFIVNQ